MSNDKTRELEQGRYPFDIACVYCGEEKATEKIINPNINMDDDDDKYERFWFVCKNCEQTIKVQKSLSIAQILGNENMISKYTKELEELALKTKKDIFCSTVSKDSICSVTFKGDSNE
jgi:hypothetical protein